MHTQHPKRLITHSEDFHTDDVFATALLLELFPEAKVIRTRDEAVIATGDIVYDVGKVFDSQLGRYDHHQAQAGKRDNGIVYSSLGLLWREYGLRFCDNDQELWGAIDRRLIMPIDAIDNGQKVVTQTAFDKVEPFTIDDVIAVMNPQPWVDEVEDYDMQFQEAVRLAKKVLYRVRDAEQNKLRSRRYLLELYQSATDKRIIIADKKGDVSGILADCPELLYVVSPRPSGIWGVLAVATEPGSFECRRPFPQSWRAQLPKELVKLTGVPDATFCHATGFYAAADTREGAIALAEKSLASK